MADFGIITAFLGGLLSFLSPCVLPLAPPYLAFMAGTTMDQLTGESETEVDDGLARRVLISSLFFVAGLATVFVALGATASLIGQTLAQYKYEFGMVAGFVIYALGQHFIGFRKSLATAAAILAVSLLYALANGAVDSAAVLFADNWQWVAALIALATALQFSGLDHLPFLMQEARFNASGSAGSFAGAYVIGLAFAFGWTPCIGPILGSILFLAAQTETLSTGVAMLFVYSLGLGTPFVLVALFVKPFMRWMRGFRRHMGTVERVMGGLLVVVGVMMLTGNFSNLSFWLLDAFPILGSIG